MNEFFYVYKHSHPETGEVVYVGKGCGDRAWVMRPKKSGGREASHLNWMKDLAALGFVASDWVTILARRVSNAEALVLEMNLINELRPKFNRNFSRGKLAEEQIRTIHQLRRTGLSHLRIAKVVGLSPMTVYRAYKGITKGYQKWKE